MEQANFVERLSNDRWYRFCRVYLRLMEGEIDVLKAQCLSKEDKYQLVTGRREYQLKTVEERYAVVNDERRFKAFFDNHSWDYDSLKFVGNRVLPQAKQETLKTWLSRRTKVLGEKDDQRAFQELSRMVDNFLREESSCNDISESVEM